MTIVSFPGLRLARSSQVLVRNAYADVLAVTANPPAVEPGQVVALGASLFNSANTPRTLTAPFQPLAVRL